MVVNVSGTVVDGEHDHLIVSGTVLDGVHDHLIVSGTVLNGEHDHLIVSRTVLKGGRDRVIVAVADLDGDGNHRTHRAHRIHRRANSVHSVRSVHSVDPEPDVLFQALRMNTTRRLTSRSFVAALFLLVASAHGASAQPAPSPTDVVNRFYQAFSTSDFAAMESLYDPNVKWKDTIFSADNRNDLMGIWRFELAPSVGGKITYQILSTSAPDAQGNTNVQVKWRDVYNFLGKPIDHSIDATLTVDKAGKIVSHLEDYSWSEWAHQAFPYLGGLVDVGSPGTELEFAL